MKNYFAYGSNMNFKQMKERCPSSKFLKRVYLKGYKFVYDGYSPKRNGAVANIVKSPNGIVWGALFEVDKKAIESLDWYEGYPVNYQRKIVEVADDEGTRYKAFVYLRKALEKGVPSKEYKEVILEGAKHCGLPKEYVEIFLGG